MEKERPFIYFKRPNRKTKKIEIPLIQEIEEIYKGKDTFSSFFDDVEIEISISDDFERYVARVIRYEQTYIEGLMVYEIFRKEAKKCASFALDQDNIFDLIIECFYFVEGE